MKNYLENYKTNLIEGKINSGKTTGIIFKEVNRAIENKENLLLLDLNEEYYRQYSNRLKNDGYDIITINLSDPTKSNNYNPFTLPCYYLKNNNTDKCFELIEKISCRIFNEENMGNNATDPFWNNTSADLFTGMSLLTIKEASPDEVNIGSISTVIDLIAKKYKDSNLIKMYLDKLEPTNPIYVTASSTVYAPRDTKDSILSVARQLIRNYCLRTNLLALISKTNFDLINIGKNKTAIFLILKDDNKNINNIANMLIEQVYYLIKENNLPFNIILDNIDFINQLNCLYNMLNNPLKNVKTIIATRNFNELKDIYPKGTFTNITNKITIQNDKVLNNNSESLLELTKIIDNPIAYPNTDLNPKFFKAEEHLIKLLDK